MLYYFPTLQEATARTCALVCLTPAYPLQLALRVTDALCSRRSGEDCSVLVSFWVTVLLGRVQSAQLAVNGSRHGVLVKAACRALATVANPGRQTSSLSPFKVSPLSHCNGAPVSLLNGPGSLHNSPQNCTSRRTDFPAEHCTAAAECAALVTYKTNAPGSPASDFPCVPFTGAPSRWGGWGG